MFGKILGEMVFTPIRLVVAFFVVIAAMAILTELEPIIDPIFRFFQAIVRWIFGLELPEDGGPFRS